MAMKMLLNQSNRPVFFIESAEDPVSYEVVSWLEASLFERFACLTMVAGKWPENWAAFALKAGCRRATWKRMKIICTGILSQHY